MISLGLTYLKFSDLARNNIMMESNEMFPKGFHPRSPSMLPDFSGFAVYDRRRLVPNLKYRFIDFGISSLFDSYEAREKVHGRFCQDRTVPELARQGPYDPFKVDIYTLGNVFKETLVEVRFLFVPFMTFLLTS